MNLSYNASERWREGVAEQPSRKISSGERPEEPAGRHQLVSGGDWVAWFPVIAGDCDSVSQMFPFCLVYLIVIDVYSNDFILKHLACPVSRNWCYEGRWCWKFLIIFFAWCVFINLLKKKKNQV